MDPVIIRNDNLYGIKATNLYRVRLSGDSEQYVAAASMREALDTWEHLAESRKRNPVTDLRFVAAAMVAVSVATPCVQAQKVEPHADSIALSAWFIGSVGARLEFRGVASPGLIGQLTVSPKPGRMWFSMGFLAQMRRWTVQSDPHVRRDHVFLIRPALGVGTDAGPSAFVFLEGGTGRIETYPDSIRGKTYDLEGIGLGAGYTVGRVTATVDLSHSATRRSFPPPDLYTILAVSLRWRLFRRGLTT